MNDERLKRLVLQLRKLDDRSLRVVEATVRELVEDSEDEKEGQAQVPARG